VANIHRQQADRIAAREPTALPRGANLKPGRNRLIERLSIIARPSRRTLNHRGSVQARASAVADDLRQLDGMRPDIHADPT
jgi:hypothetical protein